MTLLLVYVGDVAIRASILIAAVAAALQLYRGSAATRHFVWTLALVSLVLLPVLFSALPRWEIAILPPATAAPLDRRQDIGRPNRETADLTIRSIASAPMEPPALEEPMDADVRLPWDAIALAVYGLGGVLLLCRIVAQRHRAHEIRRASSVAIDPQWIALLDECAVTLGVRRRVTLLRSREELMPMAMGIRTPVIVIPFGADTWDDDRRRAVLLHELSHIARHDCFTQLLASLACALYWPHPGVWYVARRLRLEREVACDDRVLAAGACAADYARHLLELAYGWSGRRVPALVVSMAGSKTLEGRLLAVLDPVRRRSTPTRRAWLAGAVLSALLVIPVAAATMIEGPATAGPSGRPVNAALLQFAQANTSSPDGLTGTWEVTPSRRAGYVHLRLSQGGNSFSADIPTTQLGDRASLIATGTGPIQFNITREAGTFQVEGTVRAGSGAGTFTFVPNQAFAAEMAKRGFARPTALDLLAFARQDVGLVYLDELSAQKYTQPALPLLIRAANHGVGLDYLREMGRSGYRLGTLEALITLRDHGVTPDFIRELRDQGLASLSADELLRARDHGVDGEYVGGIATLGYKGLGLDRLLQLRDHGVDPDYIRGMREQGYRLEPDELLKARNHGVTPDYVTSLADFGYTKLSMDELLGARNHGVDSAYLSGMRQLGYRATLPDLINARNHGVTPDYIQGMAAAGYAKLSLESLIRLRDHGVTPDYVQRIKARVSNPSVEELIRLRDSGFVSNEPNLRNWLAGLRNSEAGKSFQRLVSRLIG
jgi:beta-lactamase regulating signal transducer with metallopeptidase domain